MQSCIYSCSPLNVVDLIVDIMFIIDILINFRSDVQARQKRCEGIGITKRVGDLNIICNLPSQDDVRELQRRGGEPPDAHRRPLLQGLVPHRHGGCHPLRPAHLPQRRGGTSRSEATRAQKMLLRYYQV